MPWCPECGTEYDEGVAVCVDCEVPLVAELPKEEADEPPVLVLSADTADQARVAVATLEAEGIEAFVQPSGAILPQGDNPVDGTSLELLVYVQADDKDAALSVLNETPPDDADLDSAADSSGPPPEE